LQYCREQLAALAGIYPGKSTEKCYNDIATAKGLGLGKVIQPSRLALTGRTVSPGMFDVMTFRTEKTLARLDAAIKYIKLKISVLV
jgi:glutamyl-tRNA synthetase